MDIFQVMKMGSMKNYLKNWIKAIHLLKTSVLFLLLLCASVISANPQELFEAANTAYQKGHYDEAVQGYENILKTDMFSKEIYFNLGNCYYKMEQLGKAVLNYERALKIAPNDEDISFNLDLTKEKLEDDLDVIGSFFP